MADNIEHLMLEQFRQLRDHQERMMDELREIKTVLLATRFQQRSMELTQDAHGDGLDSVRRRLDHIERRLELVGGDGK